MPLTINVSHERAVFHICTPEQVHGLLAREHEDHLKAARSQRVLKRLVQERVILYDQNRGGFRDSVVERFKANP